MCVVRGEAQNVQGQVPALAVAADEPGVDKRLGTIAAKDMASAQD